MGKASRKKRQAAESAAGSAKLVPAPYVARPFAGLPGEADWVAMREIVPSATATVALAEDAYRFAGLAAGAPGTRADAPREVTLCTVLPMAWPGLRRVDGAAMIALQTVQSGSDPSRDVAQALLGVLAAEPGTPVTGLPAATADTPRLQDLLDLAASFEVTVHEDFAFWVAPNATLEAEARASLDEANAAIIPTVKLPGAPSAYWCRVGERTHVRWMLGDDEDAATDALARLHASGRDTLGAGTRLLGAFRAGGLLCPVWDLDPAKEAGDYEAPMAELATAYAEALRAAPLSPEERRAKNGLLSRQLTLR